MSRQFIGIGSLGMAAAVLAGAFGAHVLENALEPRSLIVWGKAVDYLVIHSVGLVLVGLLQIVSPGRCNAVAGWLMLLGILLFCGSLFALALSGVGWLGAITPAGGLSFMAAWLILAGCNLRQRFRAAPGK